MFICSTKSGQVYQEGKEIGKHPDGSPRTLTWDDIPKSAVITQVQLTYPFRVNLSDRKNFAPLLSLGRFHQYYFANEAVVTMPISLGRAEKSSLEGGIQMGVPNLQAKIVGGVDKDLGIVIEVRVDRSGNTMIKRFPYSVLQERIKQGTFNKDILRNGAD